MPPTKIALLGNSGSGKTTLARWFSAQAGISMLDLDVVAWVPNQIAVARSHGAAIAAVQTFCNNHDGWVIEGCYRSLIESALLFNPVLIFLNPGEEQCVINCYERPWEEHKYQSKPQQDERLGFLLSFVREYYNPGADISLSAHRECYDNYQGPKLELNKRPVLEPAASELLQCLR